MAVVAVLARSELDHDGPGGRVDAAHVSDLVALFGVVMFVDTHGVCPQPQAFGFVPEMAQR